MWNSDWPDGPEGWSAWAYLNGGPAAQREFEARRRARRGYDFSRGRDAFWDSDLGGQWTTGNAGNWANPSPYSGPGGYAQPGFGSFGRHLGRLGPPVESPMDYRWGHERAGAHRGRGPKGYRRSDARILEDVCEALMFDADVDAADIEVRVEDGVVALVGTIGDRRQKRIAEDVCAAVPGVTDVRNELRVASAVSEKRRAKTG